MTILSMRESATFSQIVIMVLHTACTAPIMMGGQPIRWHNWIESHHTPAKCRVLDKTRDHPIFSLKSECVIYNMNHKGAHYSRCSGTIVPNILVVKRRVVEPRWVYRVHLLDIICTISVSQHDRKSHPSCQLWMHEYRTWRSISITWTNHPYTSSGRTPDSHLKKQLYFELGWF